VKVKCPECEIKFDLDVNEHEEEDFIDCPDCSASLIVKVRGGRFVLVPEREKYEEYSLESYYEENGRDEYY
jgi:DNA-directed RNA polymerase subunit RPC12/RpoP